MNKCLASIVEISLVISVPGAQAWGQVASTVRPISLGSGLLGNAGSITPTLRPLPLPSIIQSAPSLSNLNLAPAPTALSVAVLPTAVAKPLSIKPVAATTALTVASARLAAVPETSGKNEGPLHQLSALFDGFNTLSAPFASEGPSPEAAPAKRPAPKPFIPATTVIADMEKLLKETLSSDDINAIAHPTRP